MLNKANWHLLKSRRTYLILACSIILLASLGRLFLQAEGDPSYFILAAEKKVIQSELPDSIYLHRISGYDGLLFYRYSIDPWSKVKTNYGIEVPLPAYRKQRLMYPLLIHWISLGQIEGIPWIMILLNIFLFFGILLVLDQILLGFPISGVHRLFPLLVTGLWMSLSRDLSEITECFFLVVSIYFLIKKKWLGYSLAAALTILSRESSIVLFAGGSLSSLFYLWHTKKNFSIPVLAFLSPLITFILHRKWLISQVEDPRFPHLQEYFTWPLKGILDGYLRFSETMGWLEFISWAGHLFWIVLLVRTIFKMVDLRESLHISYLFGAFILWLPFLFCMDDSIWVDDWSYVRISSGFFLIALLLILLFNHKLPKHHILLGLILFSIMLVRMLTTA